jgi:hypothetical protein
MQATGRGNIHGKRAIFRTAHNLKNHLTESECLVVSARLQSQVHSNQIKFCAGEFSCYIVKDTSIRSRLGQQHTNR